MELIFVLVLLWMTQGLFFSQVGAIGSGALVGVLTMGLLELAALWYFRRSLPQRGVACVRAVPPFDVFARWTLFSLFCGGLLQAVSFCLAPTLDMRLQPLTQHWTGWLAAVAVAPLVEEILFRACVFELVRPRSSTPIALLLSAALFGLAHGDLVSISLAFCAGVVFGVAYLRSGSILPGLIGHATVNAAGLIAIRHGLG